MKHLTCTLLLLAGQAAATDMAWRQAQPATMRKALVPIVEQGYATGATTNQARFVAQFLLALTNSPALEEDPFCIHPADFFHVWSDVTDTPPEQAPVAIRNVLEFGQHFRVIPWTAQGIKPAPHRVLQVRIEWPDEASRPSHYEYRDRLSDPEVRMRLERQIDYVLLDYGEFFAYEHIEGVSGKPLTGGFGALFSLLGMARIESNRLAVADDGTQVTLARMRKLFTFSVLATIAPDGSAERGIPSHREDLEPLAEGLERAIEIPARPGSQPIWPPPGRCD